MIPELTAVHLKALGLPDIATRTSVLLNQRAKHYIKTTAGVTEKKSVSRVADAYVDDTGNTYVNIEKQSSETPESIWDKMQHTAQTWEQLLFRSGGRLCHKKTFW
eukprot:1632785-Ditylum_brightwellii.AAC.1